MKNKTLQEILELLQENFPKVKEKTLIKIIFSLKARDYFIFIGLGIKSGYIYIEIQILN